MATRTPSYVMFSDLKRFGHISHYEAARVLLSDAAPEGGEVAPRNRIEDRTYLSRQVVNAAPGQLQPAFFGDFCRSAQTLLARMLPQHGGDAAARDAVLSHYAKDACERMQEALTSCGIDANIYANLVRRVMGRDDLSQGQRLVLVTTLFLVMGCLSDPSAAVSCARGFLDRHLIARAHTEETTFCPRPAAPGRTGRAARMGLMRVFADSSVRDVVYPLRGGEEGTVIGALSCDEGSVTDVDGDVSARHLLISSSEGAWYATGLGSTNGTVVLRPGADEPEVIEPPRSASSGRAPRRCRIEQGDLLCLGATTRFLVVRLAD